MQDFSLSRRHFLSMTGGMVAWLAASPGVLLAAGEEAARAGALTEPPPWRALTSRQAATFDAFAAQILPADDGSPGAREAHVTRFADNGLASFAKEQRADFVKAIDALDAESARQSPATAGFRELSAEQQVLVMHAMEKSAPDVFEALRTPVIAGMFASPTYGGNANKVGWELIGFEDRFFWQPPFGFYDRVGGEHGDGRQTRNACAARSAGSDGALPAARRSRFRRRRRRRGRRGDGAKAGDGGLSRRRAGAGPLSTRRRFSAR